MSSYMYNISIQHTQKLSNFARISRNQLIEKHKSFGQLTILDEGLDKPPTIYTADQDDVRDGIYLSDEDIIHYSEYASYSCHVPQTSIQLTDEVSIDKKEIDIHSNIHSTITHDHRSSKWYIEHIQTFDNHIDELTSGDIRICDNTYAIPIQRSIITKQNILALLRCFDLSSNKESPNGNSRLIMTLGNITYRELLGNSTIEHDVLLEQLVSRGGLTRTITNVINDYVREKIIQYYQDEYNVSKYNVLSSEELTDYEFKSLLGI